MSLGSINKFIMANINIQSFKKCGTSKEAKVLFNILYITEILTKTIQIK